MSYFIQNWLYFFLTLLVYDIAVDFLIIVN